MLRHVGGVNKQNGRFALRTEANPRWIKYLGSMTYKQNEESEPTVIIAIIMNRLQPFLALKHETANGSVSRFVTTPDSSASPDPSAALRLIPGRSDYRKQHGRVPGN